jgi:predicted phage terminase large subunit-like protein
MHSICKTQLQKKELSLNVNGGIDGRRIGYLHLSTSYNLTILHLVKRNLLTIQLLQPGEYFMKVMIVGASLILLDSQKGRWDFPELKQTAYEQWKYWDPDTVIIESKASGQPLTDELRKMGIPVVNFIPSKGNDKHTRVNSVAPLFESGMIWAPMQDFAEEVIEECAAFPFGDNDDLVDSTTQAIMRFRQGGFVLHPDDYKEDPQPQRKRTYY